ncbi:MULTISPECIES: flavin reductase family protein [Saccharothrix]|uniref:flavin reductase family protein n=1 Tax=Saccharothrix TaxID=2071 RepID=UPI00093E0971|nr:flavin reductase family protein [Saccharothrix sp. CB00851]OKI29924.1 hypothetical protein A6A25_29885 [Saccharothrix sp. CB00851]
MIDGRLFRDVLSQYPSGVTIVTTRDGNGVPRGFTASAFCAVSLDPPLVCVCLARSARCHPAFAGTDTFVVNFLRPEHVDLASVFAGRDVDKFAHGGFAGDGASAVAVDNALAVLVCSVHARFEAGDHTMLIGAVRSVDSSPGEPLVFHGRRFRRLTELEC